MKMLAKQSPFWTFMQRVKRSLGIGRNRAQFDRLDEARLAMPSTPIQLPATDSRIPHHYLESRRVLAGLARDNGAVADEADDAAWTAVDDALRREMEHFDAVLAQAAKPLPPPRFIF